MILSRELPEQSRNHISVRHRYRSTAQLENLSPCNRLIFTGRHFICRLWASFWESIILGYTAMRCVCECHYNIAILHHCGLSREHTTEDNTIMNCRVHSHLPTSARAVIYLGDHKANSTFTKQCKPASILIK